VPIAGAGAMNRGHVERGRSIRARETAGLGELWSDIEAAGPLSAEDALESAPPPGVDPIWWAERSLTQEDRRRSFIARFAWSVPTRAAIDAIAAFVGGRLILEVCAGSGLWARLLSDVGVRVVATDGSPVAGATYIPVAATEAEAAVRAHVEAEGLFLCWPPMRSGCAYHAVRAFAGDRLVYAGDPRFTADAALHALLAREWMLRQRLPLPSWPGLDDALCLYERHGDNL
jgi:hypothetical protein